MLAATVQDPNFDLASIAAGTYQYAPTGTAWTFTGQSGITANGSALTSASEPGASIPGATGAPAPDGTHAAFLQGGIPGADSTISQAITIDTPGPYDLTFQAARSGGRAPEGFLVLVDGKPVRVLAAPGPTYGSYTTSVFSATAGTHTIEFQGPCLRIARRHRPHRRRGHQSCGPLSPAGAGHTTPRNSAARRIERPESHA
jgi:hypothetical protein